MALSRLRALLHAQDVVQVLNENYDWSINPIILQIRALASLFSFVEFDYIPMP